jgi:aspartyl-tRNA(Asn)/glutamyl-tRNA(Gln) amidotransferase subunit A
MSLDPAFATIAELSREIQHRRLSCLELTQATLARTEKLDPILNTYITLLPDAALTQAKVLDTEIARGHYRGPLHGIPLSIKDHIDTAGIRTTSGAKSRWGRVPTADAPVARRMRVAGTVLIGKANMNKFADGESGDNPDFGKVRNPWNREFSPGGSSAGSGAQVAAGLVPLSIGTDNGGSVRIPAALCGVVGLKPTHRRVSIEGIFPRLYSLDHAGPLVRSTEDCALALQVLAGHDEGDATTALKVVPDFSNALHAGIKGMSIGVDHAFTAVGESDVLTAFRGAIDTLRSLGASIVDVSFADYAQCGAVGDTIAACEYSVAAASLLRDHADDFVHAVPPASNAADIKAGTVIPAVDYIRATQERRVLQLEYARSTQGVSVMITPTYPLAPRPWGEYPKVNGRQYTADDATHYTFPFDVLGVPAISIPCGFSKAGAPIGLQVVARPFDESTAMRVAYTFEQATEWHTRHPPLTL